VARLASQKRTEFGRNLSFDRPLSIQNLFRITKRIKRPIRFRIWRIFQAWACYFSYWASYFIACFSSENLPTSNPNWSFEPLGSFLNKLCIQTGRLNEKIRLNSVSDYESSCSYKCNNSSVANKAIFQYSQDRKSRQLQNQIGVLNRLIILVKLRILSEDVWMRNSLQILSISDWRIVSISNHK